MSNPESDLAKLLRKEKELLGLLKQTERRLEKIGYKLEKEPPSIKPQSGIRINGQLSFRGLAKAADYFKMLDEDGDGYLNNEDFRGLSGFLINIFMSILSNHSLIL